jgi:hypothetical protein
MNLLDLMVSLPCCKRGIKNELFVDLPNVRREKAQYIDSCHQNTAVAKRNSCKEISGVYNAWFSMPISRSGNNFGLAG